MMYWIFFTSIIILNLLIDAIFFYVIKKSSWPSTKSILYNFILFLSACGYILMLYLLLSYWLKFYPYKLLRNHLAFFYLACQLSKIIFLTAYLVIYISGQIKKSFYRPPVYNPSRREFISKVSLMAASLPFSTLSFSIIKPFSNKIFHEILYFDNLPEAFEGFKIIQISDLHLGSFLSQEPILQLARSMKNLQADIVVFTGDLVNEIAEEALDFLPVLKQITSLPVYAILGNHDYGDYFYGKDDLTGKLHNMQLMEEIYQTLGWRLLKNEHVLIEKATEKIALIGVENWGYHARFQKYGDIEKATNNLDLDKYFTILLTHDPTHFEHVVEKQKLNIPLTLSGHTHGMQMGIRTKNFRWSPSAGIYKYWGGLYENENAQKIYVNTGYGYIGMPARIGIYPEITLIELRKKK